MNRRDALKALAYGPAVLAAVILAGSSLPALEALSMESIRSDGPELIAFDGLTMCSHQITSRPATSRQSSFQTKEDLCH